MQSQRDTTTVASLQKKSEKCMTNLFHLKLQSFMFFHWFL